MTTSEQVATKADLAELRGDVMTALSDLRSWLLWRMVLLAGVAIAVSEWMRNL